MKKENWGGYVSVQNSYSNQLTLNSVLSRSRRPAPLPGEETIYYLFVRASNGSGGYYQSPPKRIVAEGNVDLVVGHGHGGGGPFELKISPNPSTLETMITIKNNSNQESFDETAQWDIEIYNQTYMLQDKKSKLKGNTIQINTSSWNEGIYYIKASYKGEIINGKLVVKK